MFKKGFTILELIVSIAIFALMTTLLISKYSTFNQGVLLTNLAYDIALTIRNAQTYGLNVKSASREGNMFAAVDGGGTYGVHFAKDTAEFTFFVDLGSVPNGMYDGVSEKLYTTTIKRSSKIGNICTVGSTGCTTVDTIDITFKRPNPNAIFRVNGSITTASSVEIPVISSDGGIRKIKVNSTGQIYVE